MGPLISLARPLASQSTSPDQLPGDSPLVGSPRLRKLTTFRTLSDFSVWLHLRRVGLNNENQKYLLGKEKVPLIRFQLLELEAEIEF